MKTYILGIISAAIICGFVELFLTKGTTVGQIARLLGRLLIVISLIAPLKNISFSDISGYFDTLNTNAEIYVEDGKYFARDQTAGIIKSKLEAYILDKANKMQCDIVVEVSVSDDEIPFPTEVEINGSVSPYTKEVLCSYIEDSLGIAREKQRWN